MQVFSHCVDLSCYWMFENKFIINYYSYTELLLLQQIDDDHVIKESNSVANTDFNESETAIRLKNVRKVSSTYQFLEHAVY